LRKQRTIQIEKEEDLREMERIKQEMEQAQQDLKRERLEKKMALEAALHREQSLLEENERLKALLAQSKYNNKSSWICAMAP
jgi:hypothetical protein